MNLRFRILLSSVAIESDSLFCAQIPSFIASHRFAACSVIDAPPHEPLDRMRAWFDARQLSPAHDVLIVCVGAAERLRLGDVDPTHGALLRVAAERHFAVALVLAGRNDAAVLAQLRAEPAMPSLWRAIDKAGLLLTPAACGAQLSVDNKFDQRDFSIVIHHIESIVVAAQSARQPHVHSSWIWIAAIVLIALPILLYFAFALSALCAGCHSIPSRSADSAVPLTIVDGAFRYTRKVFNQHLHLHEYFNQDQDSNRLTGTAADPFAKYKFDQVPLSPMDIT